MPITHAFGMELEEVTRWTHNYIVSNMVSRGNRIYIGDAISSLSIIQWEDTQERLENVARDYAPLWPVSVQTLDKDNVVGCNVYQLFLLVNLLIKMASRTIAICLYSL